MAIIAAGIGAAATIGTAAASGSFSGSPDSVGGAGGTPPVLRGGGLRSSLGGGIFNIHSTPEADRFARDQSRLFKLEAQNLAGIRRQVRPGFGRLSAAQESLFGAARDRFSDQRFAAIGNLRENLARRRVLGSSFADDAIARTEAEFARADRELTSQQSETLARTFLEELSLNTQLLQQQFTARRNAIQVRLDRLNLEAQAGINLITGITSQLGAGARLEAELQAREAEAAGKFFGLATQPLIDATAERAGERFGFDRVRERRWPGTPPPTPTGPGISPSGQVGGLY